MEYYVFLLKKKTLFLGQFQQIFPDRIGGYWKTQNLIFWQSEQQYMSPSDKVAVREGVGVTVASVDNAAAASHGRPAASSPPNPLGIIHALLLHPIFYTYYTRRNDGPARYMPYKSCQDYTRILSQTPSLHPPNSFIPAVPF